MNNRSGLTMSLDITEFEKYKVLKHEIEVLKGRIQPQDTGHIYTTINTLERRCEELEEQINEKIK